MDHINMAGVRQQYLDQGQSVNIFCNYDVPKNVFNQWHLNAWKLGLKSLYYVRASAASKGDVVNYSSDCTACEG
jgi:ribonucleoside-diphosphate reductase alpha chain